MCDKSYPVKVVFCTYDSIYSSMVLEQLVSSSTLEVTAVISSSRNLKITENKFISDLQRIKFSGWRYCTYLWLVTQFLTVFPRWLKHPSINRLCRDNKIPVLKTGNINSNAMQATLKELKPDVLLCAHFNQKIHPDVYTISKHSSVNLHPSLLPDLKGVDPSFYALLENYSTSGMTLHHLDEDFDTGSIIGQTKISIENEDSVLSLNEKLFDAGAELFLRYLNTKDKLILNKTNQDNRTRYDSWPTKTQVTTFKKAKKSLISWKDIQRLVWTD